MKKMNMLFVALLVIFSLLFIGCEEDPSGPEEPGTVEGIVTNTNTGGAIVGATINDGTTDVGTSGVGGTYSFEIEEGTYTFTCSAEGYNIQEMIDIEVDEGESTNLNFQLQPIVVVPIENDIIGNTTWTNNNIYVVDGEILVKAVLTINPGTRIKFKDGANWVVIGADGGKIIAGGSVTLPIIFTSWHDDSYGGDTNGDGSATEPARGDWDDIKIQGDNNSSNFNYCQFYYGGGYYDNSVVYLESNTATGFTNCIFAHNKGDEGALDAHAAGSDTIIQNNIFYDNTWPLNINAVFSLDDSNIFHDPDSRLVTNDHNGILVDGNNFEGSIFWSETEIPFVLQQGEYSLPAGESLALNAGVVVKLDTGVDIWVNGTLMGTGSLSDPVIFTSYKDDSELGDTNNDDDITEPNPGDWDYVMIHGINNLSSFNFCEFHYGGGYSSTYTICLDNDTSANVTSCSFINNNGLDEAVLDASMAGANTSIIGNDFYNNNKPLSINGRISIDDSNTFHNVNNASQSNIRNGIFVRVADGIIGNVSWEEPEVPFVISGELQIDESNVLTLADDVVLKFDGGSIWYQGDNLINYDGSDVWFTSYKDDELPYPNSDTNGDGDATVPADGDWNGIYNAGASPGYWEAWGNILYDEIH